MFVNVILYIVPRADGCKSLSALFVLENKIKSGVRKLPKKNPKEDEAYKLYKKGLKLIEISEKLDVPAGTIRRWKSTHNWDVKTSKKESERSGKKSERSDDKKIDKRVSENDGTKQTIQNDELSPKEQLFCVYYIRTFNATQSYLNAYKSSYETAMTNGCELLRKTKIKNEINRLKEIKRSQIICDVDDLVELNMRIAFGDIGNYVSFGQVDMPIITKDGPVMIKDKDTEELIPATYKDNIVTLTDSSKVDTQIVKEVKKGKDGGISIKLEDKNKAMNWLEKFFMLNPMDKHKQEFDKRKLELDLLKVELNTKSQSVEETDINDNFLEALNASASEVWSDGEQQ